MILILLKNELLDQHNVLADQLENQYRNLK